MVWPSGDQAGARSWCRPGVRGRAELALVVSASQREEVLCSPRLVVGSRAYVVWVPGGEMRTVVGVERSARAVGVRVLGDGVVGGSSVFSLGMAGYSPHFGYLCGYGVFGGGSELWPGYLIYTSLLQSESGNFSSPTIETISVLAESYQLTYFLQIDLRSRGVSPRA